MSKKFLLFLFLGILAISAFAFYVCFNKYQSPDDRYVFYYPKSWKARYYEPDHVYGFLITNRCQFENYNEIVSNCDYVHISTESLNKEYSSVESYLEDEKNEVKRREVEKLPPVVPGYSLDASLTEPTGIAPTGFKEFLGIFSLDSYLEERHEYWRIKDKTIYRIFVINSKNPREALGFKLGLRIIFLTLRLR